MDTVTDYPGQGDDTHILNLMDIRLFVGRYIQRFGMYVRKIQLWAFMFQYNIQTHNALIIRNRISKSRSKSNNIPLGKNAASTKSIVANFTVAHVIIRWKTDSRSMGLHQSPLVWSTLILHKSGEFDCMPAIKLCRQNNLSSKSCIKKKKRTIHATPSYFFVNTEYQK